jgi:hypothetical protein
VLHRIAFPVVSEWYQFRQQLLRDLADRRSTHLKYGQHLTEHASIQLTLKRYSHWMPSMGRDTAEGIDEALG